MNIIIVESPSKSKTIESYLGKDYKVVSSLGHIRDLSTTGIDGLGIDIKNNFKPIYENIPTKTKLINELKKECKNNRVILATDPDREGEAISWHLAEVLGLDINKVERITFNEITKTKVLEAINNPSKIDMNLVNSQEARRIVDRIIGFKLSKLLQSKVKTKSAGRVQSVALKILVDLENEIKNFIPERYYEITAHFSNFDAKLTKYQNQKIELKDEIETKKIYDSLTNIFNVEDIIVKDSYREAPKAFITSTLQQEASNKLNFNPSKTMKIAQQLYEGIKIKDEYKGLITYMRTDSQRLSNEFIYACKKHITEKYGEEYVGYYVAKNKEGAQDAHEAIRPTYLNLDPQDIKEYLSNDEYKLYKLIYERAVASLMSKAKFENTKLVLNNNNYQFEVNFSKKIFDGFLKLTPSKEDKDTFFKNIKLNDTLESNNIELEELYTKPKSRYTQAKLISVMEELGIGRPSTYAQTIKTILDREYVVLEDKKLVPTESGILVTEQLQLFFSSVINAKFTSRLENELDLISNGEIDHIEMISTFYNAFVPLVNFANSKMTKVQPTLLEDKCPNCGSPLVERTGKFGKFIACNNYPKCKYIKKEEKEVKYHDNLKCELCGGNLVERTATKGKNKGKKFYSCQNYPKCTFILNEKAE